MNLQVEEWSEKGLKSFEKHDYNSAIDCLFEAIKIDPNYFIAWFRLGVTYFQKEEYEQALTCHFRAWELNPEAITEYDIIACYDKLLALNIKDFESWRKMGDFFFHKGVYEKAIECYDRALDAKKPSDSSIILNRIYINKGVQFLGKTNYVIVDGDHLKYLMSKVEGAKNQISSEDCEKLKEIENIYKKSMKKLKDREN